MYDKLLALRYQHMIEWYAEPYLSKPYRTINVLLKRKEKRPKTNVFQVWEFVMIFRLFYNFLAFYHIYYYLNKQIPN